MLMSRAFGTLLLGLATTVLGDKTLLSGPSAQVPLRDTSVKGYISVHGGPKKYKAMPESGRAAYSYTRPRRTARPANKQSIERPSRRPRRRRQNLEDEGDDTGSTQSVCQGRNGTITTCPAELGCCVSPTGEAACCPAAGVTCDESDCVQSTASIPPTAASTDLAIITVTQTSTSTVTSFAETRVVVVTSTQLLTFLNPTQRTATSTVIVTSFLRKAKRTVGRPAEITASQTPNTSAHTSSSGPKITSGSTRKYMGARAAAHKRQEATLTSTVVTTTTVFVPGITTRTLTNIVFSTTLAAPNAATTVFVTTTVFRPSTSTTAIPGVTLPVNPSPSEPTSSSVIDSEAPTSLSPTDLAEPTGLLPTNTASLASTSLSTPTATTSSSSTDVTTSTPSTSSPTETETAAILPEGTMMETMSSPPTTPTTTPIPNPFTPPQPALTPAKIAGLVLGIVLALLLFIALAFLLRRLVIRRRQAQAKLRQQLHSPRPDLAPPSMSGGNGGAPAPVVPTGPSSNGSSNISSGAYSGLTGEGEVRIVIRPAPKRRTQSSGVGEGVGMVWPMPPGRFSHLGAQQEQQQQQQGRGYSIFMEEPTTTPEKEKEWSIASERGSLGNNNDEEAGEGATRGATASVLSTTSGYGYGYSTRGESYPGLGTLLTPPPPLRLKERQDLEQERETEIRGFRTGLLGGRDTTTDGDSGSSSREGTIPPVPQVMKRPVTRGTEDSGHRADQSESNGGESKGSSPESKKSKQSGKGGAARGSGTLGKKGSFGVGKAW